ncbi:hypothetical protein PG987_011620 [Apiospora arundinis]
MAGQYASPMGDWSSIYIIDYSPQIPDIHFTTHSEHTLTPTLFEISSVFSNSSNSLSSSLHLSTNILHHSPPSTKRRQQQKANVDCTPDALLYLSSMDDGIAAALSRDETMAINKMNVDITSAAIERPQRHISFVTFEELPHKETATSSLSPEGSILRGRPTHQEQGGSNRSRSSRPPSPYPGRRQRKINFVRLPEILEMSHREAASSSTPSLEESSSILRGRPTHQKHGSSNKTRAPSPYPGRRRPVVSFDNSAELPCREKAPSPEPTPQSNLRKRPTHQSHSRGDKRSRSPSPYPGMKHRRVTFPPFWEMPIKTGFPNLDLPSNQKQFKKGGSREGSSRSRPSSPHPSSRAHRKQILQELEASRTGHRDGHYHRTTRMSGPPYTMLGLMDIDHGKATNPALWPTVSPYPGRDIYITPNVSPSPNNTQDVEKDDSNTTTAIEPIMEEKQQDQEQDQDEDQDEGGFWDTFEDFNVPQIPQSHYYSEEVESTEPRREGGGWWFSRWFSSSR